MAAEGEGQRRKTPLLLSNATRELMTPILSEYSPHQSDLLCVATGMI